MGWTLPSVFWQKEFARLIQNSGVLVVLSQAWIEELYHQVLERNLLAEAGYWGSAEEQALPLITMLTGTHPHTESFGRSGPVGRRLTD